jgi:hypothetical protein
MVCPMQESKVYGYVTNTKVKIVLVAEDMKEHDIRLLFQSLQSLYVDHVSNPFYTMGDPITSAKFDKKVHNLIHPGGSA